MNCGPVFELCVLQARLTLRNARDIAGLKTVADYVMLVPADHQARDVTPNAQA